MRETRTDEPFSYSEIRVPSRVVRVWRDETGWYCALEDGRVFVGEWNVEAMDEMPKWAPFLPAVEDR